MAQYDAVWGIDIGQCALKALRCRRHEKDDRIVADAFDYVEYPQILGAPGADPVELVRDAMDVFLSRNKLKGDGIAIAVPGQSGLSKFIKLPPVESKKIPEIVRFEARQQIPFDLKRDVVWDFQRLEGGAEEEGFILEAQIGLFAIKRDQLEKAMEPFTRHSLDVDIVQLSPLSLYNMVRFDQLTNLPAAKDYDAENPPKSVAILSVGTESSDLVITDGYRIWQRSVPIGGNHFTRELMKNLRLAFPKAEHLKRNATSAQDPKAVFQAMRPAFNDFLTEVQRSLNFFSTLERSATVESVLALGNAMKLPGLRKFLEQNLGMPINRLEVYRGLVGSGVVNAPAFQENLSSFGACYGLALQGLGRSTLRTNLIAPEVVVDRIIRTKKPWGAAVAAVLLLGFTVSYLSYARALSTVSTDTFGPAETEAQSVAKLSQDLSGRFDGVKQAFDKETKTGANLVGNIEDRILWLELFRGIRGCMPVDKRLEDPKSLDPKTGIPLEDREQIHITSIDCAWTDDLNAWFSRVADWYQPAPGEKFVKPTAVAAAPDTPPADTPPPDGSTPEGGAPAADAAAGGDQGGSGPKGPGWVIQIRGKHYHNSEKAGTKFGAQYVQSAFISKLQSKQANIRLLAFDDTDSKKSGKKDGKDAKDVKVEFVSMHDLGVSYPVLVNPQMVQPVTLTNPYAEADTRPAGAGAPAATESDASGAKAIQAREFAFEIQMAWQQTPPSKRAELKKQKTQDNQKPANP